MVMREQEQIAAFFHDCFHDNDYEGTFVKELFHDHAVGCIPVMGPFSGVRGIKQVCLRWVHAFPNLRIFPSVTQVSETSFRATWKGLGTHDGPLLGIAPTGQEVTLFGNTLFHFQGEKAISLDSNFDPNQLYQQLLPSSPSRASPTSRISSTSPPFMQHQAGSYSILITLARRCHTSYFLLSEQEAEIIALLSHSWDIEQIAAFTHTTKETAENLAAVALKKLNCSSPHHLAQYLITHSLLSIFRNLHDLLYMFYHQDSERKKHLPTSPHTAEPPTRGQSSCFNNHKDT